MMSKKVQALRERLIAEDPGPFTIDDYDPHADLNPKEFLSLLDTIEEQENRLEHSISALERYQAAVQESFAQWQEERSRLQERLALAEKVVEAAEEFLNAMPAPRDALLGMLMTEWRNGDPDESKSAGYQLGYEDAIEGRRPRQGSELYFNGYMDGRANKR